MRRLVTFVSCAFGLAALAGAQTPATVDFLSTVLQAPSLAAAGHRAAAARERIAASGLLPDPQLAGMASQMVGPMNERARMWEVTVSQPLPRRGERAASRQKARAAANMAQADYAVMAGEMAADTAMELTEAGGADARIRLLNTQTGRLAAILGSIDARLAAGSGGSIAERLAVETRLASMRLMIEEESRMAAEARAGVTARLGLQPGAPLPSFAAPAPSDVTPDDAALVKLAEARAAEADAMIGMARASARPMTSIGVRFERESREMGDANTLGVALMTEIPWRSRRAARHEIQAAQLEKAAAGNDAQALRHRIRLALDRVGRAQALADTARKLAGETLARLNAEYDAMIQSAAVGGSMGRSTVLEIVELLEKATETEQQTIRADTAVQTARAELWRYVSASRFTKSTD